jgi:crotonobetainyl-CoA:carnitine CoA-transferase CaiB-like acyl-CoA transferase
MGPTCGLILADLGAEVIKVEPVEGDNTRRLTGSGAGFFPAFNRNKKSLAIDIRDAQAKAAVLRLVAGADIVSENFRPGAMEALGLGEAALRALRPDLIYVSHKGFLAGPYAQRTALDEVVQMMAGLAYMTGPPGRPLRAGASVNDIMGGMFGAIGAIAALYRRDADRLPGEADARGEAMHRIDSGLFENCAFLVAQHMMQAAVTGKPAAPMPARVAAWGIYDVFTLADRTQLFLAVVSDTQWKSFCAALERPDWFADPRLTTNPLRVAAREWLMPQVAAALGALTQAEVTALATRAGLPWAPITRPDELFDDPHLNAAGGLAPMTLPSGTATAVPLLPLSIDGERLPLRQSPPAVGQHTRALLADAGLTAAQIDALIARGAAAG